MIHRNVIAEHEIADWATASNSKDRLPNLVRRLVVETTPLLKSVEFPLKNGNGLPNFDGFSDNLNSTKWVDAGKSYWKVSRAKNFNSIESKYLQKIKKVPTLCHQPSSFVFIAPRDTSHSIEQSGKEFKGKGNEIHQFRILNADHIASWVETTVATKQWLSEQLGRINNGVQTPSAWWKNWNSNLKNEFSTSFISTRQFNDSKELINRIHRNESEISVMGDTQEEAVAFVIASLFESPRKDLLDRVVVVSNEKYDFPELSDSKLIIICDFPEDCNPQFGNSDNQVVVRTYQKGTPNIQGSISLSSIPKTKFQDQLKSFGIPKIETNQFADECGYSVPILKQKISRGKINQPDWVHDSETVQMLVPLALCGKFYFIDQFDTLFAPEFGNDYKGMLEDKLVLAKIGNLEINKIDKVFKQLKKLEDTPLIHFEDIIQVKSQFNLIFDLKDSIQISHLNQFFEIFEQIMKQKDPLKHVKKSQRNSSKNEESLDCSEILKFGLCNSLCILAIYGNAICGNRLGIDIPKKVDEIVGKVLNNVDSYHRLSIRQFLHYLAEASPKMFFKSFSTNRVKTAPRLGKILDSDYQNMNKVIGLQKKLFQVFESLAWHPEYFKKVANVLFWISSIDSCEEVKHFSAEITRKLFRVCEPSTRLPVPMLYTVLKENLQAFRAQVFDVCVSQLRESTEWTSPLTLPKWRVLDQWITPATKEESKFSEKNARQLLFKMAPFSIEELQKLLSKVYELKNSGTQKLLEEVETWSRHKNANDNIRAKLRASLFASIVALRYYQIDPDDSIWESVEKLNRLLTPQLPSIRHRWLFDWDYINWTLLTDKRVRTKPVDFDQMIDTIRKNAVKEILKIQGTDALINFIESVNHSELVARSLLIMNQTSHERVYWVKYALQLDESASTKQFISQMLRDMNEAEITKVSKLVQSDKLLSYPLKQLLFVKSLPTTPLGWSIASKMGSKFENIYWESIPIWFDYDISKKDLKFAVNKLLSCGRRLSAFNAAEPHLEKLDVMLWKETLESIARSEHNISELPYINKFDDVMCLMDEDTNITDIEIAEIELPYIPYILEYGEYISYRTLVWHRLFNNDPEYLVLALFRHYNQKSNVEKPDLGIKSAKMLKIESNAAELLLNSWNNLPCVNKNGKLNQKKFDEWTKSALAFAEKFNLTDKLDHHLLALFKKISGQENFNKLVPEKFREIFETFNKKSRHRGFTEVLASRRN